MPLMRFTKFTDKVRNHRKTVTFRRPRKKNPIKQGDMLHIYTLEKIGTATVSKITRTTLRNITFNQAVADGFLDQRHCVHKLMKMHKLKDLDTEFDFIEFEPHWVKNQVLQIEPCFACGRPAIKLPYLFGDDILNGNWMCTYKFCGKRYAKVLGCGINDEDDDETD